jgi:transcriptional regulator with XRE-family HTH domain
VARRSGPQSTTTCTKETIVIGNARPSSFPPIDELIAHLRTQHGLTQYELADQLVGASGNASVTREEVSRWERGKRIPGPYWRHWLSEVLGYPGEKWERAALAARRSRQFPRQRSGADAYAPSARR